jgi:hypothetical protein
VQTAVNCLARIIIAIWHDLIDLIDALAALGWSHCFLLPIREVVYNAMLCTFSELPRRPPASTPSGSLRWVAMRKLPRLLHAHWQPGERAQSEDKDLVKICVHGASRYQTKFW